MSKSNVGFPEIHSQERSEDVGDRSLTDSPRRTPAIYPECIHTTDGEAAGGSAEPGSAAAHLVVLPVDEPIVPDGEPAPGTT